MRLIIIIIVISLLYSIRVKQTLDELDAINELDMFNKQQNKLLENQNVSLIADKLNTPDQIEISSNAANLLSSKEKANKSFYRLNRIASLYKGVEALKSNSLLKNILKMLLKDTLKSLDIRTKAAQLTTRISDIPTTIQTSEPDKLKNNEDLTSVVVLPRINRIYMPDKYVENIKAGNWEP